MTPLRVRTLQNAQDAVYEQLHIFICGLDLCVFPHVTQIRLIRDNATR
jgi:hypothetical protein